jgi:hypothetical protein
MTVVRRTCAELLDASNAHTYAIDGAVKQQYVDEIAMSQMCERVTAKLPRHTFTGDINGARKDR